MAVAANQAASIHRERRDLRDYHWSPMIPCDLRDHRHNDLFGHVVRLPDETTSQFTRHSTAKSTYLQGRPPSSQWHRHPGRSRNMGWSDAEWQQPPTCRSLEAGCQSCHRSVIAERRYGRCKLSIKTTRRRRKITTMAAYPSVCAGLGLDKQNVKIHHLSLPNKSPHKPSIRSMPQLYNVSLLTCMLYDHIARTCHSG